MRSTRTSLRLAAAATAVALLFTGCSAQEEHGDATPASQLVPPAEGGTHYPLTLETPFGDTELEERPERIAVVTANTVDSDALLGLGVVPVFAPSTLERNAWLEPELVSQVAELWESEAGAEISPEAVAASEPDLIVALAAYETFDQDRFDKLSDIAPVLYAAQGDLTWQDLTLALGEPLDLAGAAEAAVSAAEEAIEETTQEHPELAGHTATHVIVYEEQWGPDYASYPGSDTEALLNALGMSLPAEAEQFVDDGLISLELAGVIDADFLLLSTFAGSEYFTDSPIVQAVPAVAEGRSVTNPADPETGINYFAWGLNNQSIVSVPWLLDQLADFASEALA